MLFSPTTSQAPQKRRRRLSEMAKGSESSFSLRNPNVRRVLDMDTKTSSQASSGFGEFLDEPSSLSDTSFGSGFPARRRTGFALPGLNETDSPTDSPSEEPGSPEGGQGLAARRTGLGRRGPVEVIDLTSSPDDEPISTGAFSARTRFGESGFPRGLAAGNFPRQETGRRGLFEEGTRDRASRAGSVPGASGRFGGAATFAGFADNDPEPRAGRGSFPGDAASRTAGRFAGRLEEPAFDARADTALEPGTAASVFARNAGQGRAQGAAAGPVVATTVEEVRRFVENQRRLAELETNTERYRAGWLGRLRMDSAQACLAGPRERGTETSASGADAGTNPVFWWRRNGCAASARELAFGNSSEVELRSAGSAPMKVVPFHDMSYFLMPLDRARAAVEISEGDFFRRAGDGGRTYHEYKVSPGERSVRFNNFLIFSGADCTEWSEEDAGFAATGSNTSLVRQLYLRAKYSPESRQTMRFSGQHFYATTFLQGWYWRGKLEQNFLMVTATPHRVVLRYLGRESDPTLDGDALKKLYEWIREQLPLDYFVQAGDMTDREMERYRFSDQLVVERVDFDLRATGTKNDLLFYDHASFFAGHVLSFLYVVASVDEMVEHAAHYGSPVADDRAGWMNRSYSGSVLGERFESRTKQRGYLVSVQTMRRNRSLTEPLSMLEQTAGDEFSTNWVFGMMAPGPKTWEVVSTAFDVDTEEVASFVERLANRQSAACFGFRRELLTDFYVALAAKPNFAAVGSEQPVAEVGRELKTLGEMAARQIPLLDTVLSSAEEDRVRSGGRSTRHDWDLMNECVRRTSTKTFSCAREPVDAVYEDSVAFQNALNSAGLSEFSSFEWEDAITLPELDNVYWNPLSKQLDEIAGSANQDPDRPAARLKFHLYDLVRKLTGKVIASKRFGKAGPPDAEITAKLDNLLVDVFEGAQNKSWHSSWFTNYDKYFTEIMAMGGGDSFPRQLAVKKKVAFMPVSLRVLDLEELLRAVLQRTGTRVFSEDALKLLGVSPEDYAAFGEDLDLFDIRRLLKKHTATLVLDGRTKKVSLIYHGGDTSPVSSDWGYLRHSGRYLLTPDEQGSGAADDPCPYGPLPMTIVNEFEVPDMPAAKLWSIGKALGHRPETWVVQFIATNLAQYLSRHLEWEDFTHGIFVPKRDEFEYATGSRVCFEPLGYQKQFAQMLLLSGTAPRQPVENRALRTGGFPAGPELSSAGNLEAYSGGDARCPEFLPAYVMMFLPYVNALNPKTFDVATVCNILSFRSLKAAFFARELVYALSVREGDANAERVEWLTNCLDAFRTYVSRNHPILASEQRLIVPAKLGQRYFSTYKH